MADHYDDYTREELIRLLRERDRKPKFGLVWERDEIEHEKAINDDFVALDFDAGLSCGAAPFRNLIIEGDNFDALRFLRMTHAGKVKCIYIDPPYNTGNRDFIYNDRFIDKEDAYKHSKWLEFMYRRLELAKELLAEDGVIFVSIDDNEVFNLGLLMNRVFGENNFIADCIWQKRYSSSNDHKTIAPMHEYILVYQASGVWNRNLLPREKDKDRQYRFQDDFGIFRISDYTCNKSAEERPNLYYPIIQPNTNQEVWPKKTRIWAYSKEEHQRHVQECLIYWGKDGLAATPSFKRYKRSLKNADGIVPNTWWAFEEVGHTDTAKKELLDILSEHTTTFSTPKPVRLIERILRIATKPGDLVLDFFAGSGTTAHAVLKLNQEDGGNRRFILVSNTEATADAPDKNLCRDVCAERVRRVITGYRNKKGEWVEGLGGDLLKTRGASFAYLRARRIPAETILSQIEHEQVWTALQLIHTETLAPFDAAALVQRAETENGAMLYVPKVAEAVIEILEQAIHDAGTAVIYSWQPGWLNQQIEDERASFQAIPQFLVNRFNLGART
ncbi:MAG TPA: site-specific DNA-methyltransferase [Candidatus Competibacteraceae bacterium]|nr:site-specific DNA-methyltransferase [Candidatus Competibacteraceae bacterium]HRZ05576.1 site-specific DNA-methyltransferase [Candidatus Competibacteraceae bacterium]HSA46994.1 site-specific DNA-methyltransferase [Candidatus Competibacteraceae bacterium]